MIKVGSIIKVVTKCWWTNSAGDFALLGLEGVVVSYDPKGYEDGPEIQAKFPAVGQVLLTLREVEVIT